MCSRVFWSKGANGQAHIVGRNMDWDSDKPVQPALWVLPRGRRRTGKAGSKSLAWTADYGSIVATMSWRSKKRLVTASADGINEKHLAGHLLWLEQPNYGRRQRRRPRLNVGLWLQYCLDKFGGVDEVIESLDPAKKDHGNADGILQLVPLTIQGEKAHLHLALEDRRGKRIVIEYKNGRFEWHCADVVTNTWTCRITEKRLKKFYARGGLRLPGSNASRHRFARAAWFLERLPEPQNKREAIAFLLSIMRNVSQPFRRANRKPPSATWWRTVCDLSNGDYYFESTMKPNIVWVGLSDFNFDSRMKPRKLDLSEGHPDLVGDVHSKFRPCPPFVWPSA